MDGDDFTAIAHEGLAFMNPLAEEDVDEMIEALELEPNAHVLDLDHLAFLGLDHVLVLVALELLAATSLLTAGHGPIMPWPRRPG